MWTIKKVKEELPNVQVQFNNRVFTAHISGKKNKEATVTISEGYSYAIKRNYIDFHFSWEAVVRSLNSKVPLET